MGRRMRKPLPASNDCSREWARWGRFEFRHSFVSTSDRLGACRGATGMSSVMPLPASRYRISKQLISLMLDSTPFHRTREVCCGSQPGRIEKGLRWKCSTWHHRNGLRSCLCRQHPFWISHSASDNNRVLVGTWDTVEVCDTAKEAVVSQLTFGYQLPTAEETDRQNRSPAAS